jgi:Homeodomain-like domain
MRPPRVRQPLLPPPPPYHMLSLLHGSHRTALRLVMILLSHHGLSAAAIAELLGCDPGTVRRGVHRYNPHGTSGLGDRPRAGRPPLGSPRLHQRILTLLDQPKAWTIGGCGSGLADPPSASARCVDASGSSPAGGGGRSSAPSTCARVASSTRWPPRAVSAGCRGRHALRDPDRGDREPHPPILRSLWRWRPASARALSRWRSVFASV